MFVTSQLSLELAENGSKKRNHPASGSCEEENDNGNSMKYEFLLRRKIVARKFFFLTLGRIR